MKTIGNGLCCYLLKSMPVDPVNEYCGVPTNYTMVRDDDGNLVRKYNPWCLEHTMKVRDQEDE